MRRKGERRRKLKSEINTLRSIARRILSTVWYSDYALAEHIAEELGVRPDYVLTIIDAINDLRLSFPGKSSSWYERALIRAFAGVKKVSDNHWIVKGFPELGDEYSHYNVVLSRDGKYVCDCMYRMWGYVRKAKICTHVAAVMLHRRIQRRLFEF